jgi:hypothetical protein
VREEMMSAPDPLKRVTGADTPKSLKDGFLEIYDRLRIMVDEYEEEPETIDSGVLKPANVTVDVAATIKTVYQLMKTRVHAEDSPLRANADVWEALQEQWDEFISRYRSARSALIAFNKVLEANNSIQSVPLPRGDLEKISRDEHALGKERDACIDAVTNFYGKFAAMFNEL